MFKDAYWIWNSIDFTDDEYVDFYQCFNLQKTSGVKLHISVDGMFCVYLNGKIVGFGECSDDENNKLYDTFSLDKATVCGDNELLITVWHHGSSCAIYKPAKAGCIFTLEQNGKILAVSKEDTLSRISTGYKKVNGKYLTPQLGLSFKYDSRENEYEYSKSAIIEKSKNIQFRDIENLILTERQPVVIENDGKLVTIDLKKETAGFLELDFESEDEQELTITYGEHLDKDGKVTRIILIRDFSVEYIAKKGENNYINPLRRLAGRYIQFETKHPIKINYVGIRGVYYPVNVQDVKFSNPLHNDIYQTCIHTLKCCMHAHYEDCPWREQALYALDSRNQMLCGYVAFKEFRYARHNLILLSRAYVEQIKLLNLTYPRGGRALCIPFFSLAFVMQACEYIENSGDKQILKEIGVVIENIMDGFKEKIDKSGLIPYFPYPCWNFYEWTLGNDNEIEIARKESDPYHKHYDLIINAMYVYVRKIYDKVMGNKTDLTEMVNIIKQTFYKKDKGLFINTTANGNYSVVANVFALLCGAADSTVAQKIVNERKNLVDISLSMNGFLYEALLSVDVNYKDYIIKDIEEKYGYMLSQGATTFWETIVGASDFGGAGSLCHGWSALPVYWLNLLAEKE